MGVQAGMKASPQVFEAEYATLDWKIVPGTVTDATPTGVRYADVKTKTVTNSAYGVQGGLDVDVILFEVNSPLCTWFSRRKDAIKVEKKYEQYIGWNLPYEAKEPEGM